MDLKNVPTIYKGLMPKDQLSFYGRDDGHWGGCLVVEHAAVTLEPDETLGGGDRGVQVLPVARRNGPRHSWPSFCNRRVSGGGEAM